MKYYFDVTVNIKESPNTGYKAKIVVNAGNHAQAIRFAMGNFTTEYITSVSCKLRK